MNDEKDTRKILLQWNTVTPDRRQWKPGMPVLSPLGVVVSVNVPVSMVINETQDATIISPEGMKFVIDQLEYWMSDRIDKENKEEEFESSKEESKPPAKDDDNDDDEFDFGETKTKSKPMSKEVEKSFEENWE